MTKERNSKEHLSKNFTRGELECPHCGALPDPVFIVIIQRLRDRCGFPLHVTSGCRCTTHNRNIKGYQYSAHKVVLAGAAYGAIDVKTGRYNNKFRWTLITTAISIGFNNIEVCNFHTHIGRVGPKHPGFERIIWGVSK